MTERTEAAADEIESQRETIRSLHTALDDLTRAGLEMERAKNEEIAVLRADLARARRNAAHFEQLFENVEKARAWFSRELDAARAAVGEAWFAGGVTLAEAIRRKCRALEGDASRFDSSEVHRTIQSEKHMSETDETDVIKYPHHDMHLRDLLAAKVIQGLLANPSGPIQVNGMSGWGWCNCTIKEVADLAWFIADHMLKARGGSNAG